MSVASLETEFTFLDALPSAPDLILNEVLASHGAEGASDWIELYNTGRAPLALAGVTLTDDWTEPGKFAFPAGLTVAPGSYLVVACDKPRDPGRLRTGFKLAAEGENLTLLAATAQGWRVLDSVTFGLQVPDRSVGRDSSQPGRWTLTVPTPGAANQVEELGDASSLRLNEWLTRPLAGDAWVEVYNSGPRPVALAGLGLTDDLDSPFKCRMPALSFLAGNGRAKIEAARRSGARADRLGFELSEGASVLGLFSAQGARVDVAMFAPASPGVSLGRIPDGGETIYPLGFPTPGMANAVDLDSDGLPDDWQRAQGLALGVGLAYRIDSDGDGASDLDEYWAGTNPEDPADRLRIETFLRPGGRSVLLGFQAKPGRAYRFEYRNWTSGGAWLPLSEVPAQPYARPEEVSAAADPAHPCYYRVALTRVEGLAE